MNNTENSKSQETVVGNEVTNKILDRYGVKAVTQDELKKREEETSNSTPAVTQVEQVKEDDGTITLSEEELQALEASGIPEEELSGKTMKEIKALASDKLPKQEKSQEQKIIISDSYADQLSAKFPFAKSLKGKSMDEVMDIIQKQNSYITTLETAKKKNKSEEIINNDLKTDDDGTGDNQVLDLLTLKPDEATKKLNDLVNERASKIAGDIFDKKIKEMLPNIEPLQQASQEAIAKQFYEELGSNLPEGADPKAVMDEWKKANEGMSREEKVALVENPTLLIKLISKEYALKTNNFDKKKIEEDANKEVKKKTYENLRKLLKNSQTLGSNATFNVKRKSSEIEGLDEDSGDPAKDMMSKIIARNVNR